MMSVSKFNYRCSKTTLSRENFLLGTILWLLGLQFASEDNNPMNEDLG